MTVGVLGHPVERRYQLTPPPSRFYLVHFSGELLLDALAKADMVRTVKSHTPESRCPRPAGTRARSAFTRRPGTLHAPVDGITNLPQFRFRFTQYDAVITIAVEMTHGIPVLQIMVQIHRQKQIAGSPCELRRPILRPLSGIRRIKLSSMVHAALLVLEHPG